MQVLTNRLFLLKLKFYLQFVHTNTQMTYRETSITQIG